jgi:NAD(P)H dehydrogenase (quinone)
MNYALEQRHACKNKQIAADIQIEIEKVKKQIY